MSESETLRGLTSETWNQITPNFSRICSVVSGNKQTKSRCQLHPKYALFYTVFVNNTQVAKALSHKSLTAQVHNQSQARPCGTWSGQSGIGTDLSLSIQLPPANILPLLNSFTLNISHSLSHVLVHACTHVRVHTHTHTHTKAKGTDGITECRPLRIWSNMRLLLTGSGFASSLPIISPTPGAPGASSSLLRCSAVSASLCAEGSICNCAVGFKPSYSTGSWFSNCDAGLSYGNARNHCVSIAQIKLKMLKQGWACLYGLNTDCSSLCMSQNLQTVNLGSCTIFKVR
jgi:hypothetical protein